MPIRHVRICDAAKGKPCAVLRNTPAATTDCLACQVRDMEFEDKLRDSSPGRSARVCRETPPGQPCYIARDLGQACLACQLRSEAAHLGICRDEYRTLQLQVERLEGLVKTSEPERQRLEVEVEGWAKRISALVKGCGREETCKGSTCEATIYFIRTKAGRMAPYDLDGTTHFATCQDSKSFQRNKKS